MFQWDGIEITIQLKSDLNMSIHNSKCESHLYPRTKQYKCNEIIKYIMTS